LPQRIGSEVAAELNTIAMQEDVVVDYEGLKLICSIGRPAAKQCCQLSMRYEDKRYQQHLLKRINCVFHESIATA